MTALIWTLSIIAVFVLIGLIPLKVWVNNKAEGVSFGVKLSFVKLFPKTKADTKSEKTAKKSASKGGNKSKKKLKLSFELVRSLLEKAAKIPGMLTLDRADVCFIAAGGKDPFRAALLYGGGWAAEGILYAAVQSAFKKIKDFNYRSAVDYDASEDVFEFDARISVRLWQLVLFAAGLLGIFMKLAKNAPKEERSKADGEE